MKKYLLTGILFASAMFLIGASNVQAKSCSAVTAAPHMYQVSPEVRGKTFDLNTASSTCKGSNTEVWFTGLKSLPSSWTHSSGNLWIDLYEEDPPGNADEHVKRYIGWITNKTITDITVDGTMTPGNIDSSGDQTCELYLTFVSSGTYGLSIEKSLFNYQICMN